MQPAVDTQTIAPVVVHALPNQGKRVPGGVSREAREEDRLYTIIGLDIGIASHMLRDRPPSSGKAKEGPTKALMQNRADLLTLINESSWLGFWW